MHFGGQRSDGRRYVTSQLLVAGSGASSHLDGVDVIETDASNCLNVPAEALMMEAPIRVHRLALARDSGGPGTHRGGLGGVFEYELLDGETTVTYRGERHLCEAEGVAMTAGGRPCQRGDPARRRRRRSHQIEDRIDAAQRRSHRHRDRRWRRLWRADASAILPCCRRICATARSAWKRRGNSMGIAAMSEPHDLNDAGAARPCGARRTWAGSVRCAADRRRPLPMWQPVNCAPQMSAWSAR